jgi:hypothetical protein
MSKRTTGTDSSDSPTPAPSRRKAPAADDSIAPKTRSRRRVTAAVTSEATDVVIQNIAPTQQEIATRAYFIALEHGFSSDPVANWLQAEQQLREAARS